jgi:O-succinylbenzoic acid--CoA ligase
MTRLSIFDAAREVPDEPALIDGASQSSFAQLAERVRAHVEELAPLVSAMRPGVHWIALGTANAALALELILALFELEIRVLPVHARLTPTERERLLAELPVAWYLDTTFGATRVEPQHPASTAFRLRGEPHGGAALATSGSSGAPRVALLSQSSFLAAARASAQNLGWRSDDRWLLCLPLAHVGGLSVVTRCLLARRPVVLVSEDHRESSGLRIARAIDVGRATLLSVVPAQLDGLLSL